MDRLFIKIGIGVMVIFVVIGIVKMGARAIQEASGPQAEETKGETVAAAQGEIKTIQVEPSSYNPDTLQLKAGVPYQLRFVTNNVFSCIRSLVFPELGIRENLPATGEKIIQLPALQPGQYQFTCAMGMYRGTLLVN